MATIRIFFINSDLDLFSDFVDIIDKDLTKYLRVTVAAKFFHTLSEECHKRLFLTALIVGYRLGIGFDNSLDDRVYLTRIVGNYNCREQPADPKTAWSPYPGGVANILGVDLL